VLKLQRHQVGDHKVRFNDPHYTKVVGVEARVFVVGGALRPHLARCLYAARLNKRNDPELQPFGAHQGHKPRGVQQL